MRYQITVLCTTLFLLPAGLFAQEKIYSGPQPGEELRPFKVLEVIDAETVEEKEYVKADEEGPTLVCFMHKISEPALGLLITLEYYASQHEDITTHLVMLTDDRDETEKMLKRWATRPFFVNGKMSLSPDGVEGPGDYGLNRNVTATILVGNNNKVVNNFAYQDPNQEDAGEILAALATTAGLEKPSIDEIRKQIRAQRDERRKMRMKQHPLVKLAPNEDIGELMLALIRSEGDREANAKRRSRQLLEWAGNNEERKAALRKYCKAVLEGEFEINEHSRKALQKIAEDKQ